MDKNDRQAQLAVLIARYGKVRLRMVEELEASTRHKLEHGTYPEDMGKRFRELAEKAQELQERVYDLRKQTEAATTWKGVEAPDFLPEEL